MENLLKYIKLNKPIYIYGKSSTGKTTLLKNIENYNVYYFSIQEISSYDDLLTYTNPSIVQVMNKNTSKTIIIIDDIDFIQINEKKILNSFIKQFKQEEKKNKPRNYTIIFSGTNYYDKKIKEIIKLCNVIKLEVLYKPLLYNNYEKNIQNSIKKIMNKEFTNDFIIENEKATQSLLFHENIIDIVKKDDLKFYYQFLKNLCCGDYFDRISFQKQLWIFNEMTYYIKIVANYHLFNNYSIFSKKNVEYRFTKVLTKYSNEYNNNTFINMLCNRLNCSKKTLYLNLLRHNLELSASEEKRANNYFQIK
uniref:ATPase AAA-type core domain-containing protein n=1 Tax=viral metagenome TaxID=1070528 RepID=A0A6C0EUV9_9ZZZZ